ncbi:hypothetical protein BOX15_Mlig012310g1 [Macrostomum lignano]|uniref:Defective in cullin neddylation protein n=1 Tax=Macrostomum lignano TaxID=282301 RepID=A0A267DK88_9PLAT|nr:hypothetical protein BOX15_Mlig012310g1 [Macrostomum lignano]
MGSCLSLKAAANPDMMPKSQQQSGKRKRRPPLPVPNSALASDGSAKTSRLQAGEAYIVGGDDRSASSSLVAATTEFDRFFASYAFEVDPTDDNGASAGASTPPLRIGAGGVAHLCRDLGLDPVDIRVLLLAWLCRAREMCAFTEAELRRGCAALRQAEAPTADGLRAALDARLDAMTGGRAGGRMSGDMLDVKDIDVAFKDLYRWAFDFGLESGQRTLQLPMATDLWALVFEARPSGVPPLLGAWLTWLQSGASGVKGVSRDTWNMFLTFIDTCGSDLSAYDHNEAWPSLIDDFVEAETDRANQNLLNC